MVAAMCIFRMNDYQGQIHSCIPTNRRTAAVDAQPPLIRAVESFNAYVEYGYMQVCPVVGLITDSLLMFRVYCRVFIVEGNITLNIWWVVLTNNPV